MDIPSASQGQTLPLFRHVLHPFVLMTDAALLRLGELLSLSMTLPELALCRYYYANTEKRNPTEEELRMLDHLLLTKKQQTEACRMVEFLCPEGTIRDTYEDLCTKEYALSGKSPIGMSLYELSQVAARYHRMIGRIPPELPLYAGSEEPGPQALYFRTNCGQAIAHIGSSEASVAAKPSRLPSGKALCLLTPSEENASIQDVIHALRNTPETTVETIDRGGLLSYFIEHTEGVFADLTILPCAEDYMVVDEESPTGAPLLTILSDGYEGCHLVITSQDTVPALTEQALSLGFTLTFFARSTTSGRIALREAGNPHLNLSLSFVRRLISEITVEKKIVCPEQSFWHGGEQKPIFALHGSLDTENRVQMTDAITLNERLYLPSLINCGASPFGSTVHLILSCVLGLCAHGADRRQISLSVLTTVPRLASDEGLSNVFSALLGLYRAEIELSLPEIHSRMEYQNQPQVRIGCTASAPQPSKPLKGQLQAAGSFLYLLPVPQLPNGLPDFSSARSLCDCVTDHNRKGHLLSACVVNGALKDTFVRLTKDLRIQPEERIDTTERTFGILLESTVDLPFFKVGKVVK